MVRMKPAMAIERKEEGILREGAGRKAQRRGSVVGRKRIAEEPDTSQRPLAVSRERIKIPPLIGSRRPPQPVSMRGFFGGI